MSYVAGDSVRIAARQHEGHHRTPGYLKGKAGRVERAHEAFTNPETRAYGADGLPLRRLYLVSFAHEDVWPGRVQSNDRIFADVYEHWLETA